MRLTTPPPPTSAPTPSQPPGRGFWPMRDLPTAFWLILTLAAVIGHRLLPYPRWLIIHLLLLGAITHAILVWSQYFSFALLRSRASHADRRTQNVRLLLANGGAAAVLIGVPNRWSALTILGAAALTVAVVWHALSMYRRGRGSLPGQFGRTIRYYIASALLLSIGLVLGTMLAVGAGTPQLALAHALINVLGWIGLTVAGTVVTLWPTILRTRADAYAATGAARALPLLACGVLIAGGGAAFNLLPLIGVGFALYFIGLLVIGVSLVRAARQAPPKNFAALSVGAALTWWAVLVAIVCVRTMIATVTGSDVLAVGALVRGLVPLFAAGFVAQVLIGALSYLVPVVLGGGPQPVKIGARESHRLGVLRVTIANVSLVVWTLPVTDEVRAAAFISYVVAVASFLLIMMRAMRAQRQAKKKMVA